jgi:hypothetical protein
MSAVETPPQRGVTPRLPPATSGWAAAALERGRDRRRFDRRWALGIALLLAAALGLRLWGASHGLPYAYNADENAHFVPKAIGLFGHSWNPEYFVNPPGYTYLLHLVFLVWYGGREGVSNAFATDPSEVFLLARVIAAICGTVAVGLLYLAGARLFDRRAGLLSAAMLSVAFLPVFYSHLALNDVPTLVGVCLALAGVGGIVRRGAPADYVMAGVGLGLGCATKYTAGIVLLPLVAAAVARGRPALPRLALAGGVALVAFLIANPYALLDFAAFREGLNHQSTATNEVGGKLGLTQESGVLYYLWTLTWGLGWAPSLAAAAGAVLLAATRPRLFWVLVPAPIIFLLFMGTQERFFGRWLIPVLPIVCLVAAYAAVQAVDALARRRPALGPALIAIVAAALCVQGVVYSVHLGLVLSREDTRGIARDWLVDHAPPGAKIVVEPGVVPDGWSHDIGEPSLVTSNGYRWIKYPTSRARTPQGGVVNIEDYERTLEPELIDEFEKGGYCWIVSGSTQSGRAFADPDQVPGAIDYYRRLRARGAIAFRATPYREGADPVPFNFDWSFDFYPLAYERPGPVMTIYRLDRKVCKRGIG